MKLTKEQAFGILRHAQTFIGGAVVAKGYASDAAVTEIIGAVMTLAGAVWSVIDKK